MKKLKKIFNTLMFLTILALLFVVSKQNGAIVVYKQHYAEADSAKAMYEGGYDTIHKLIVSWSYNNMLIENIQANLAEQEALMKEDPEEYFKEILISNQKSIGGE